MNHLEKYIEAFLNKHPQYKHIPIDAFAFGAVPDELADLVVRKIKTGTSSLHQLYELEDEPIPTVGKVSVVLDGQGLPVTVIELTNVEILPFSQVTEHHAFLEGEGDRSLAYWRQVHLDFFTAEANEYPDVSFSEESLIVYETFQVID